MPFDGTESCSGCTLFQHTQNFLFQPFTTAASRTNWFLFVGLVLIAAFLWTRILRTIEELI